MQIEIQRYNRKSIVITVNSKAEVIIKAPYRPTEAEIQELLKKRAGWIKEHVDKVLRERERADSLEPITNEDLRELGDKAVEFIPKRVEYFAEKVGVSYGRITIKRINEIFSFYRIIFTKFFPRNCGQQSHADFWIVPWLFRAFKKQILCPEFCCKLN